jgi:hypothetical protein
MGSSNLLKETIDIMTKNGKDVRDIIHIGSPNGQYEIGWEAFKKLADKNYNNQTQKYKVAYDLTILFSDNSWLEREHDTTLEYWRYHRIPKRGNSKSRKIKTVWGDDQTIETLYSIRQKVSS